MKWRRFLAVLKGILILFTAVVSCIRAFSAGPGAGPQPPGASLFSLTVCAGALALVIHVIETWLTDAESRAAQARTERSVRAQREMLEAQATVLETIRKQQHPLSGLRIKLSIDLDPRDVHAPYLERLQAYAQKLAANPEASENDAFLALLSEPRPPSEWDLGGGTEYTQDRITFTRDSDLFPNPKRYPGESLALHAIVANRAWVTLTEGALTEAELVTAWGSGWAGLHGDPRIVFSALAPFSDTRNRHRLLYDPGKGRLTLQTTLHVMHVEQQGQGLFTMQDIEGLYLHIGSNSFTSFVRGITEVLVFYTDDVGESTRFRKRYYADQIVRPVGLEQVLLRLRDPISWRKTS